MADVPDPTDVQSLELPLVQNVQDVRPFLASDRPLVDFIAIRNPPPVHSPGSWINSVPLTMQEVMRQSGFSARLVAHLQRAFVLILDNLRGPNQFRLRYPPPDDQQRANHSAMDQYRAHLRHLDREWGVVVEYLRMVHDYLTLACVGLRLPQPNDVVYRPSVEAVGVYLYVPPIVDLNWLPDEVAQMICQIPQNLDPLAPRVRENEFVRAMGRLVRN